LESAPLLRQTEGGFLAGNQRGGLLADGFEPSHDTGGNSKQNDCTNNKFQDGRKISHQLCRVSQARGQEVHGQSNKSCIFIFTLSVCIGL